MRLIKTAVVFCAAGFLFALEAQTVRFSINGGPAATGNIDVTLRPDVAPMTVANFLSYLNAGAYNNTIIHRSVPNFVVQAGGYQLQNGTTVIATPQNAPITNEYSLSNTEGTIAMAQSSSPLNNPPPADTATNQWFFNTGTPGTNGTAAANAASLNSQQFAVFGSITAQTGSPNGLALMTAINNLPVFTEPLPGLSADGSFGDIPLVNNYAPDATIMPDNFVLVSSIVVLPVPLQTGVLNAASTAPALGASGIAPGELLTIYGKDNLASLGPTTGVSFNSSPVSTMLGNTQVLFNNIPGPMLYSSSGQVNVVVPYGIAGAAEVTVVVQYNGVQSEPLVYRPVSSVPGIFTLNGYGTGDAAVVDNTTGAVISASNPASVGEVLALFGTGQGVSTTASALADGVIVGSTLPYPTATVTLLIDGQTVQPLYAGGAPGDVNGVLQVDFRVPQGLAAGSHQIQLQMASGGTTYTSPTGVNLQTR